MTEQLRYGPHPDQIVDLWPAGDPLVVLLHGGYWRVRYDRASLAGLAKHLAGRGVSVALPEYRRVGGGGGWPATFDDVAAVLDSCATSGQDLVLVGHSAGGQLALWAAGRNRLPEHSAWYRRHATARLRKVVVVAPVADLTTAHQLNLSAGAVGELLGGRANVAARLPHIDPMALLPLDMPVTVLHGDRDTTVPLEISARYAVAAGCELVLLPGADHFDPVTPPNPAVDDVVRAVLS